MGCFATTDPSQSVPMIQLMDRGLLEKHLGEGLSLAEIGALNGKHESTVAYWLGRHGLTATNRAKHAARGALPRPILIELIAAGWSTRKIATAVDRSATTVRHWLAEYGLSTKQAVRIRSYAGGEARLVLECPRHGVTEFGRRRGGGYRCLKCRTDAVSERRRRVKQVLVEEAGGACALCGYDRCVGALQFHHVDPSAKKFALSHRGISRSIARARQEAAKCVLLCGNCHVEVESGLRSIPLAPGS
jgi:transposase